MKPEERAKVMKTLKELTEKITQLQNEMAPTLQGSKTNQAKTKTDVGPALPLQPTAALANDTLALTAPPPPPAGPKGAVGCRAGLPQEDELW